MVSNQGLVSVIITTYNRHDFLQDAIASVEQQSYETIELIVVDGHSTESPAYIVNAADHDRFEDVIFIRHDENRGVSAARNSGMQAASGEYIALLDDDDIWLPEKIERQVQAFELADDDVGLVYTGVKSVTDDGEAISVRTPTHDGDVTKALLSGLGIPLSSIIIRQDVLDIAGEFEDDMQTYEDREWIIRLSDHSPFAVVDEPLVTSRRGGSTDRHQLTDNIYSKAEHDFPKYLSRCRPIAAQYGWLFERKMVAWSHFRVGYALIAHNEPVPARRYFRRALMAWPFAPRFLIFFVLALFSPEKYETLQQYKRLIGNYRRA